MNRFSMFTPARAVGLAVALVLLVLIAWAALDKYRETVAPEPARAAPPIAVQVETAAPGHFAVERTWRGQIAVDDRATLSAQWTAAVEALPFREGQHVGVGEIVYRLDDSELNSERDRLEAVVERLQGELETAQRELARQRDLYERKLTPENLLDQAAQRVDSLRAQRREAEANRSLVETRLSYTIGKAPFTGTVQRLHVQLGELARVGSPVLELVADDTLKAEVQVAQNDVPALHEGLPVSVRVPALDRDWEGRIDRIYPALDDATRNATIAVLLPAADGIQAGMAAVVHVRIAAYDHVLTLPAQAVHSEHGADWVFVAEGDHARRRAIDTGETGQGRVHVRAGLEAGAQVIVTADPRLRDGAAIHVVEDGLSS